MKHAKRRPKPAILQIVVPHRTMQIVESLLSDLGISKTDLVTEAVQRLIEREEEKRREVTSGV